VCGVRGVVRSIRDRYRYVGITTAPCLRHMWHVVLCGTLCVVSIVYRYLYFPPPALAGFSTRATPCPPPPLELLCGPPSPLFREPRSHRHSQNPITQTDSGITLCRLRLGPCVGTIGNISVLGTIEIETSTAHWDQHRCQSSPRSTRNSNRP
jgi:hypothetical protein